MEHISLKALRRATAGVQLVLFFPPALFMTSLLLRHVGALSDEPARSAQQIVAWYSARMWTLWVLLITLPLAVMGVGFVTLLRSWNEDPQFRHAVGHLSAAVRTQRATIVVALTSLAAASNLAFVIVHMLAN